jgi:hypothetical protein
MNPVASIKSIIHNLFHIPTIDIKKLEESTAEMEAHIKMAKAEYHAMKDFVELAQNTIHGSAGFLWYKDLSGRYRFASRAMVSRLLLPQIVESDDMDITRLVVGKTDQQIAAEYNDSHLGHSTFLNTLSIADQHTLQCQKSASFFETGLVNDQPVWIQSERMPAYDQDGNLAGISGWGYDSTFFLGDPRFDVQGWVRSGRAVELDPAVFLV